MKIKFKFLSLSLVSFALFACSGGGGGGNGGGVGLGGGFIDPATCTLPVGAVTITAANAETVVSEVKAAIQTILAFANANSDLIILNNVSLASNPQTFMCASSGSFEVTLTGLNPISMGDQLALNFSSCTDTGTTINGLFSGTYNTITEVNLGEAGNVASMNNWDFNISSTSDNLRVNDSNVNVAADGDVTADVAFTVAGANLLSTATNTLLTFADNTGECASIGNANITATVMNVTTNPAAYTLNVNQAAALSIASTELGGTVQAQTPVTAFSGMENLFDVGLGEIDEYFVELDDALPPSGGVLVITGNLSNVTATVMAGGIVQIDVDIDGDNMIDNTIMTTWAAL